MTVKELVSTCCMDIEMSYVGHYNSFSIRFSNLDVCIEENLDMKVTNWKIIFNHSKETAEFHMWVESINPAK